MGLEAVKDEIIRTAKEQETSMLAEARKEANRMTREAEKKAEEMREKSEAETKRTLDIIKKQELASAELESKKALLDAKKHVIDNAFVEARKYLEHFDDKKREIYLGKLLEKAKMDIEPAVVYCNKKDAKFLKRFNAQNIDAIGGLIAENRETTIRVDYSFDTMLQSIKDNELQNINNVLFG